MAGVGDIGMHEELRGISSCTACAQYDWNEHRCRLGCYKKEKVTDYFFQDCPLPKVTILETEYPLEHYDVAGYIAKKYNIKGE